MAAHWDAQTRLHIRNGHDERGRVRAPRPRDEALDRMAKVRAVAFDLDSTLVDFMRWKQRACESAVRALIDAGLDLPTSASVDAHVPEDVLTKRLMETYFETDVESDRAITDFLERIGAAADPAMVSVAVAGYRRGKTAALEPYPRTVPTLVKLCKMGYQLAVVTDAPRSKAVYRLAATDLLPFFDTVLTSCDIEGGKSTTKPFEAVCDELDREPEQVLMVGDWPERDIRLPKQMGMPTALAHYGWQSVGATLRDEDRPDVVLYRIDDLARILERAGGGRQRW